MSRARGVAPKDLSPAAAKQMGEVDGLQAAQAIAAVFSAAYTPALYGAVTLAMAGLSAIPSDGFFRSMAEDAHGRAWPWRGSSSYSPETREARKAFDEAFKASFGNALRSGATIDSAIHDLAAELQGRSTAPRGSGPLLAWIGALDRLGQRQRPEEERLARERRAELASGRPCRWILPAPRQLGWLERGSAKRAYPKRITQTADGFVAEVVNFSGTAIFRATFASMAEAEQVAAAFVSVRWQIGRLAHLSELDRTLDMGAALGGPHGADAFGRMLRVADRVDRSARGLGLGDFTDSDAWTRIDAGDVAGLIARFKTPPFGLTEYPVAVRSDGTPASATPPVDLPSRSPARSKSDEATPSQGSPWAIENAERDAGLFLRAVLYAMQSPDAPKTAKAYAAVIARSVSEGNEKNLLVFLSGLTYFVGKVHFQIDDPFQDPRYMPYARVLAAHFMNAATQCLPGPSAPAEHLRNANAARLAADVSDASIALVEALDIVGASAIESVA